MGSDAGPVPLAKPHRWRVIAALLFVKAVIFYLVFSHSHTDVVHVTVPSVTVLPPTTRPAQVIRHLGAHAIFELGQYGNIDMLLRPDGAPQTVANIRKLVETGWFNGTTLYRYEPGFCLQGGGWPHKSSPFPPVPLEYKLPNKQWAVSMARTADPNSATTEFSIMLGDNSKWLGPGGSEKFGYAVFAEVVGGFETIASLGRLPTRKSGLTLFVDPVKVTGAYVLDTAAGTVLH
jgi:peptidyl-prolyl cis-trans isomerase A (cyclophilin A)